jgi:PLP dependent protein
LPRSCAPLAPVVIDIETNLLAMRERIARASATCALNPPSLLAVSKGMPESDIRRAFSVGQLEFAESYVQEAVTKIVATQDLPIVWHFIGPIQSNKTSTIAENFSWVHSVDRIKIAARLSAARPVQLESLNICIQINSSGEASKSGVAPAQLAALAEEIAALPGLKLRGLMAIPAPSKHFDEQRHAFQLVREQFEALCRAGFALDTLSMGMSDDLDAAIAEGTTMVRVGTAIFGPRTP